MATHSSILAWENTWTEESGGLQSMGTQRSDTTERLNTHVYSYWQQYLERELMKTMMKLVTTPGHSSKHCSCLPNNYSTFLPPRQNPDFDQSATNALNSYVP